MSGEMKQSSEKVVKDKAKNASPKKVNKGKTESTGVKRRSWTMQEKVDIIQWHRENNSSQSSTAMLFGCDRKCIREWDRNYQELLLLSGASSLKKKKKLNSGKKPLSCEMDQKLVEFLEQQRDNGIAVSNTMLQSKACELSKQLNIGHFVASQGWLKRWKKRSNVGMQLGTNEHLSSDTQEQMVQFQRSVIHKRKAHNLAKDQIVNMHQIIVRFNSMIESTHGDKLKQAASGGTKSEIIQVPLTDLTEDIFPVPDTSDEDLIQVLTTGGSEDLMKVLATDGSEQLIKVSKDGNEELIQVLTDENKDELLPLPADDNDELIKVLSRDDNGDELIQVSRGNGKEVIQKRGFSVSLCTCADGQKLPAYVVFKKTNGDITPETKAGFCMPANVRVGASSNGRIHDEWLLSRLDALRNYDESRPLLLILDRHNVSNAISTCKLLEQVNIETVSIPADCTAVSQMMDACINMTFKNRLHQVWKSWVLANKERTSTGSMRMPSRYQVINWVSEAWQSVSEEKIKNAFLKCGISNTLDGSEDSKIMVCREFAQPKEKKKDNALSLLVFTDDSQDGSVEFEGFGDEDDYEV